MGNIKLNGKQVIVKDDTPSLLELVAAVERDHVPEGWIIVEVKVDGKEVEGFTEDDGSLIPFDSAQNVSIITRKTSEIQISILERFEKYLERLAPSLKGIADLFRGNQIQVANELYLDAIEGIQVLIEHIQGIRKTQPLEESALTDDGRDLDDLAGELKRTLEELVSAQEAGDHERIADALEFDLIDQLGTWQAVLPELQRRVADSDSN